MRATKGSMGYNYAISAHKANIMSTFTVTYSTIARFRENHGYEVTRCRKIFNVRTGKLLKQIRQGGSFGYIIGGSFVPHSKIKEHLEKIPKKEYCPF